MEKAFEFNCPICGSLCQTTEDMRGKETRCLMCTSRIVVPKLAGETEGMDMQYFLKAGVVQQKLKSDKPGGGTPSKS
jgi:DNA-directed RNA polymerase subunit RPC12/RpoP